MALTLSGNGQISTLVGQVCFFAMTTAPSGFIKANGAAVSRTTYADLFSAIGTTYGSGDGSTTFNLPDLRGEFPRGLDDGRGVDTSRAIGTAQTDAFQGHKHAHEGGYAWTGAGAGGTMFGNGPRTYEAITILDPTESTSGVPRTASETRPRNVALLACIKF